MRGFLAALLLCGSVAGQSENDIHRGNGSFYVNGIVYQYVVGTDYAVVAAAHSVINHKFVAVKVRVYNMGLQSVTVKPEDLHVEDTLAGQMLSTVSGTELAKRMRRPYNWARLAVNPVAGEPSESPATNDTINPQLLEMMRVMTARANGMTVPVLPGSRGVLYTDTAGALQSHPAPTPAECDTVCRLRNREAAGHDVLAQLQRQSTPDYVEQNAFLANTITPHSDADGVLYCPMPKLAHGVLLAKNVRKAGVVRVTVPVGEEKFQFLLMVE